MVMCPSQSQTGILLLWILCAITYNSAICIWGLKVQCNETDRQKLLNFKEQVIDSSGMLSAWSNEQDCCGWAGVECDHLTHRVTNLSLPCQFDDSGDCLAGEFSLSNLIELKFLNYLDLSNNNLLFSSPRFTGNFSSKLLYLDLSFNDPTLKLDDLKWLIHVNSLEYLNLNGIHLHTSLWLQFVSILPSLSELQLHRCQLHDINPSLEFVNFTLLQVLDLSYNYFHADKLPKWLFNLSHVRDIDLRHNFLQNHIPETILNLRKLRSLKLSHNELDGLIPNELGQLENLEHLDISENLFVGPIPETLGNLSILIELSLSSNFFSGSLPENLGNLSILTELYLSSNFFNGSLPESFEQLSNLEILDISEVFFTGFISERHFLQLYKLQELYLGSPTLTFHFDSHWIPSFQLQKIWLAYVHPKLPAWLYTQKSLQSLHIYNSSLSFEDQDKFWNFVAELEFLKLFYNSISGDLSKVLLNSRVAWLEGNNFIGEVPQISPNMTVFIVSDNSISGSLSSLLCQKMDGKSKLSYLSIINTPLSGGLTECWINWKSLVHIALINNSLTGKIPESTSSLSNLESLHLYHNNLFGHIPASLRNCQKLRILNLGENKFYGNLPYWISQNVNVLMLRSNQFSGGIPPQLCQLSSLVVLDVADNRLSGTIPSCLGNITALVSRKTSYFDFGVEVSGLGIEFFYYFDIVIKGNHLSYSSGQKLMLTIDLSNNNLIGIIPPKIFTLFALQSLNLSNNELTGRMPKEIGNLKQLESLDLSSNKIGGEIPQNMSELSSLGSLNLSFNNFIGQIPPMAQFQRFDVLCFIGNPGLCGAPLSKNCTQEANHKEPIEENEDEEEFLSWFYIGMGVGFASGFWAVSASLFFNRTWRHTYFRFLQDLANLTCVFVVLMRNIFR